MTYRSAAFSDTGKVRRDNQDRFLCDEALAVYGVADGVGGLPGGAEAAQCAIDTVRKGVAAFGVKNPNVEVISQAANAAVGALGDKLSPHTGIATTLTFGVIREDVLTLAHVGDSRCYLLRENTLVGLTEDDSMENEIKRRRARGELVFLGEYQRNALSQCIGQPSPPLVAVTQHPLRAGDRVLFASDGITRLIRDKDLASLLSLSNDPAEVCKKLVDEGNARGGLDNLTAIVFFADL